MNIMNVPTILTNQRTNQSTSYLPNSVERFSYLGDDNSSAGRAIIYILLNPNVHYSTQNSLPWIPTKPSWIRFRLFMACIFLLFKF